MKLQTTSRQASILEITPEKQVKAYLRSLPMKILGFIIERPMIITQARQRLKVHPANITHHFKIREKAKLILLDEE